MVGRYAISTARSPRPIAASTNAMEADPSPAGRSKPNVNNDEPLAVSASRHPCPTVTSKNNENAPKITTSATAGKVISASGA